MSMLSDIWHNRSPRATLAFLRGEFSKPDFSPQNCIHLAVDLQEGFVAQSPEAAQRVTTSLMPELRRIGVPTWATKMERQPGEALTPENNYGELIEFEPGAVDRVVAKTKMSAFTGTDLAEDLHRQGVTTVFVSGYKEDQCARYTAIDAARAGFRVVMVSDCLGLNGEENGMASRNELRLDGVSQIESRALLVLIDPHKPGLSAGRPALGAGMRS